MSVNCAEREVEDSGDTVEMNGSSSPYAGTAKERQISKIGKLLKIGRKSSSFEDDELGRLHLSPTAPNRCHSVTACILKSNNITFRKSSFLSLYSMDF